MVALITRDVVIAGGLDAPSEPARERLYADLVMPATDLVRFCLCVRN